VDREPMGIGERGQMFGIGLKTKGIRKIGCPL